jgi:heat-inducible transcriptional repressor
MNSDTNDFGVSVKQQQQYLRKKMTKPASQNLLINDRQKAVLFHLVAEYIASGRPVSSMTLTNNNDLRFSTATIRRDLHALSEMGYLAQPHTSAGRVPTDSAFRLFVDALKTETLEPVPGRNKAAVDKLRSLDLDTGNLETRQEAVRILSDFLYQAALLITPALSESVIRQLRFIPISQGTLLAVIITKEGVVHNTYVKSPTPVDDRELERIHNYLAELIAGRTLNQIREILRGELDDAKQKCDQMRERAASLGREVFKSGVGENPGLMVDGRSHLAAQPELRDRLEELMQFLEEKSRILTLLDQTADMNGRPIVIIGREGGVGFEGCAMVSAPFGPGGSEGQIGVVGSSRMDYTAAIPLVRLAAELLTRQAGDK